MNTKSIFGGVVLATALSLALTGCVQPSTSASPPSTPSPSAEPSTAPEESEPVFADQPEEQELPQLMAFGDSMTYEDNVGISVSVPSTFTPGKYAAGADQANNVYFSITISNNSGGVLDPSVYARVSSAGVESSSIFDSGNSAGEIGGGPSTVILPGGTITWLSAFSVADPNSLILQIAPSYEYEDAIFTNQQ